MNALHNGTIGAIVLPTASVALPLVPLAANEVFGVLLVPLVILFLPIVLLVGLQLVD